MASTSSATPRVRDHIGYMGQKVSLYQGLSLRENVEFYAGLHGLAGAELERRWGALRDRFALAEAEREQPADLPAAIRQPRSALVEEEPRAAVRSRAPGRRAGGSPRAGPPAARAPPRASAKRSRSAPQRRSSSAPASPCSPA